MTKNPQGPAKTKKTTARQTAAAAARHPSSDLNQAGLFLELLQPEDVFEHEFCWLVQTEVAGYDSPAKQRYMALPQAWPNLQMFNGFGCRVFVAINEIRPTFGEKGDALRPTSAVTRIRAVFADFDNPKVPLPAFELEPSIIVCTSPGKHHVYWLVELADPLPVAEFDNVQQGIIEKYRANGSDPQMRQPNHMMRLPGTVHCKREPRHLVQVVSAPGHRYTAAQLRAAFPFTPPVRRAPGVVLTAPTAVANLTAAVVQANWGAPNKDGMVIVDCPWQEEHSEPAKKKDTSAAYWLPNERNGWRGWFECKHAHCENRKVQEFDKWVREQVDQALKGGAA